jgi:NADPH-dependent 2,4-dienoyl-CoA reductase/sulfur reductase-like enzyme
VLGLDLQSRRLQVEQKENGKTWWEPFDQLMIATGAVPIWPKVSGSDAQGIYGVNTLQSGDNLRGLIVEKGPKRGVVVGGGYIGLEMAEALIRRGLEVSLVELADEVMNTLDPDMGRLVSEALMNVGVTLYRKEGLQAFEVKNGHVVGVVTDQRTIPADLVILGMGVRPNSSLAEGAGISLGVRGSIPVNDLMQTEIEGVWAAGDCAQTFHLISRRPFHIALGTVANKMGRVAGINLGGGYARFPGVVGTAVSKICAVEVARTWLQEKEIRQLGWEYISETIESTTRAGYYPDSEQITVKVLADKGSGKLLGGQIVGKEGAAKRIDILAAALHGGFTLDEMVNLDLSYAPPYAPVWDPVIIAARQALKKL